jgi:hypothetical protein
MKTGGRQASRPRETAVERNGHDIANGAALASFLGAGIGAFAMCVFASMNEAGIFVAPSLYVPAGGVSGRTTFAAVAWLMAWGLLHRRWKDRQIAPRRVYVATVVLTGLGLLGTFPPVWGLF